MGVKGLWPLVAPTAKPISMDSLDGKVLAVDVAIWLNKAAKGMRDRKGYQVYNAHLVLMFHRICKLLFYGVKPVIVFDGGVPELKKETLKARRNRKFRAESRKQKANEAIIQNFLQTKALEAFTGTKSSMKLKLSDKPGEPDMFELPAATNSQSESSDEDDLLDEEWLEALHSQHIKEMFDLPSKVDIYSEEFISLPVEMKHELLVAIKDEQRKKFKRNYNEESCDHQGPELPEEAATFSDYQLKNLQRRGIITHQIDQLRKEMNDSMSAEFIEMCSDRKFDPTKSFMKSRKLASDGSKRMVLIKHGKHGKSKEVNGLFSSSLDDDYARFKRRDDDDCNKQHFFSKLGRIPAKFQTIKVDDPSELNYPKLFSDDSSGDEKKCVNENSLKINIEKRIKTNEITEVEYISDNLSDDDDDDVDWIEVNDGKSIDINKVNSNILEEAPKFPSILVSDDDKQTESFSLNNDKIDLTTTQREGLKGNCTTECLSVVENTIDECSLKNKVTHIKIDKADKNTLIIEDIETEHEDLEVETDSVSLSKSESKFDRNPSDNEGHSKHHVILNSAVEMFLPCETSENMFARNETNFTSTVLEDKELVSEGSHVINDDLVEVTHEIKENYSNNILEHLQDTASPIVIDADNLSNGVSGEVVQQDSTHKSNLINEVKNDNDNVLSTKVSSIDECSHIVDDRLSSDIINLTDQKDMTVDDDTSLQKEYFLESLQLASTSENVPVVSSDEIDFIAEPVREDYIDKFATSVAEKSKKDLILIEDELREEQIQLHSDNLKQTRQAATLTSEMYGDVQELLRLFGIPYLVSPMEAEAQCAQLELSNMTDGSITDDGDVFLFGGQTVYKNIFNKKNYAELYQAKDLESVLYLSREKLIALAFLTGSDYTVGLHGIGYVTAMEILHAFSNPDPVKTLSNFKNWILRLKSGEELVTPVSNLKAKLKGVDIPTNFNIPEVWEAYLQPIVEESDERFVWGKPVEDAIKDFAKEKFGWLSSRTNEVLAPVLKRWNERTKAQKTIDRYFTPQIKLTGTAVKSKRLQKVLNSVGNLGDDEMSMIADEFDPISETNEKEEQRSTETTTVKKTSHFFDDSMNDLEPLNKNNVKRQLQKTPMKNKFDLNKTTISSSPEVQAKKVKNLINAAAESFKPLPPYLRMNLMNKSVKNRLKGKKTRTKKQCSRQKEATALLNQANAISNIDAPKRLVSSESDSE